MIVVLAQIGDAFTEKTQVNLFVQRQLRDLLQIFSAFVTGLVGYNQFAPRVLQTAQQGYRMFDALAWYNTRWLQNELVLCSQSDLTTYIAAEFIDGSGWIIEIQYVGNQYRGNPFAPCQILTRRLVDDHVLKVLDAWWKGHLQIIVYCRDLESTAFPVKIMMVRNGGYFSFCFGQKFCDGNTKRDMHGYAQDILDHQYADIETLYEFVQGGFEVLGQVAYATADFRGAAPLVPEMLVDPLVVRVMEVGFRNAHADAR